MNYSINTSKTVKETQLPFLEMAIPDFCIFQTVQYPEISSVRTSQEDVSRTFQIVKNPQFKI